MTGLKHPAILIPIKPEYVEKIRNGTKKYELRRRLLGHTPKMAVVYETRPVKKITGFFTCPFTTTCHKKSLWDLLGSSHDTYSESFGLTWYEYMTYFDGVDIAHALDISDFRSIEPLDLSEIGISHPPQNMQYLNAGQWHSVFDRRLVTCL